MYDILRKKLNLGMKVISAVSADGDDDVYGYDLVVDESRYIPDTHQYLFSFVQADLEKIDELLNEAVSRRDPEPVVSANEILGTVHPYFGENEHLREGYIYRSLSSKVWRASDISDPQSVLTALGVRGNWFYDSEAWLYPLDKGNMESLITAQEDVRKQIALLLSDNNDEYAGYPAFYKYLFYNLASGKTSDAPPFDPVLFTLPSAKIVSPGGSVWKNEEIKMDFDEDYAFSYYDAVNRFTCDDSVLPDAFEKIRRSGSLEGEGAPYEEVLIEYFEDLLEYETASMLIGGIRLKKCKRCGSYFPVTPGNSLYCTIPDKENGKSCYMIAEEEDRRRKAVKLYKRAYKTHHDRIKARHETKAAVDEWRGRMQAILKDVISGEIELDEYRAILMQPAYYVTDEPTDVFCDGEIAVISYGDHSVSLRRIDDDLYYVAVGAGGNEFSKCSEADAKRFEEALSFSGNILRNFSLKELDRDFG